MFDVPLGVNVVVTGPPTIVFGLGLSCTESCDPVVAVLPAPLVVFGLGLSAMLLALTVAPVVLVDELPAVFDALVPPEFTVVPLEDVEDVPFVCFGFGLSETTGLTCVLVVVPLTVFAATVLFVPLLVDVVHPLPVGAVVLKLVG